MKVSVIIPFYSNIPGILIKSVQSCLDQTYRDIELIVVDDCSPLIAEKELSSINDKRLNIIRNATNLNGAVSRNKGVKIARGEVIAFLDYDDIWLPEKISIQLDYLKSLENENSVIYAKSVVLDGNRKFIVPKYSIRENQSVGDYMFHEKQLIQTSGILLYAKLAREICFDDLKRHQDYQYCLSLEKNGASFFLATNKPLYKFIQIHKKNDYEFSIHWLERYSGVLSKKAIKAFQKKVVLSSMIGQNEMKCAIKYAVENRIVVSLFSISIKKMIKKIVVK
ncbi:glycosyltransferase family 2 protein [Vibrio lentus]|uniref:Glycosyltransferase 2-like domain-containing protein n=1 Tax=Vibrio lentus TaxID=136468 RepID=A0A2N7C2I8_9VIBR|nr:glycosyltransferase family 2 protein [Vibrio lentus]PME50265.1 hypothetical protein BCV34_11945 [Vibrio lentus]PME68940.1 hypothetical protein BCV30_22740 [Vibrio lentus]PME90106.1 hypothetical protein BCV27_22500 [Vibrio lentus]